MKKKDMKFKTLDSMQGVVNVLNDANEALIDKTRTIQNSAISDVLMGTLGAGIGGVMSFAALYGLGTVGLSAAGITSGLAAAGAGAAAITGASAMVAGVFVLAAPVAILAGAGVFVANKIKAKQLSQEKDRLLKEAIKKHNAIINEQKNEIYVNKERADYLNSLNILLSRAIKDLKHDLEVAQ